MTDGGAPAESGLVVVGIDASPAGLLALRWAVGEAVLRGYRVEVVHAWESVPLPGNMFTSARELRTASEMFVANEIASVSREVPVAPPMTGVSVQGSAAKVLCERAAGASLLVVGRGRRAAVRDLLPRSVSASVVRGARCPVLIVPVPEDEPADAIVDVDNADNG